MAKIKIWTSQEIEHYENPPLFNGAARKKFFDLPVKLRQQVEGFYKIENRVGFNLMFGYFKACRRFFLTKNFREQDIRFIGKKYGHLFGDMELCNYKCKAYNQHRKIILGYFGYSGFGLDKYGCLIGEIIAQPLQSFASPQQMSVKVLSWLSRKHIELPAYVILQSVLTKAIRTRDKVLHQKLEGLMQVHHKKALDKLLDRVYKETGQGVYVFVDLKKLIRKDNVKSIKANIKKHEVIRWIYQRTQSLYKRLDLNENAIQHFAERVIKYKSNQLIRRKKTDQYLLLLGFVVFQFRQFEDQLTDTFLSACRSALSAARNECKEYSYTRRKEHNKQLEKATRIAQDKNDLINAIRDIVWEPGDKPSKKIAIIQKLIPLDYGQNGEQQVLDLLKQQYKKQGAEILFNCLEKQSVSLQRQVSPLIKSLHFNAKNSSKSLIKAINYFKSTEGKILRGAPSDFLDKHQQEALIDKTGYFRISLYKILFFQAIFYAIKSGELNLQYSFRYKAFDEYLFKSTYWKKHKNALLGKAELGHLENWNAVLEKVKPLLEKHLTQTNNCILDGDNPFFNIAPGGKYHVKTPKLDKEYNNNITGIFPKEKIIPLSEVLATVDQLTNYLKSFKHYQPYYKKARPHKNIFFAAITAYGCNIGVDTMAQVTHGICASGLGNTANWYFDLDNIYKANNKINDFTGRLELANLFQKQEGELHTSSDGQKINVASAQTIDATYSYKYFGKGKGVTSYAFIDERSIPFYSTIISTPEREAIYVLDGLLHNKVIRSTIHSTDRHGYTEAVFGLTGLLGFGFAPRIAKLYKQHIYCFGSIQPYRSKGYHILPSGCINTDLIEQNWDDILRLVTSVKLNKCTASQIFKRLNSYSEQHPVYKALKEYGKIFKTIFILRYIDTLNLRQAIQKQLNIAELSNRFSNALCVANGNEMIFITHNEQLIADACKNLIKSAIICWNYLFMTRYIQNIKSHKEKLAVIEDIKAGTAIAWRHIYFNGIYDFSHEKLADSFNLLDSQNYSLNLD